MGLPLSGVLTPAAAAPLVYVCPGTYCIEATASLYYDAEDLTQSKKQQPLTRVHVGEPHCQCLAVGSHCMCVWGLGCESCDWHAGYTQGRWAGVHGRPRTHAPVFPRTAAGMPQGINQPYMYSGVMLLYVSFPCPDIWNSDYITFRLRRVDLGLNRDIFSAEPSAGNASPRLVRGMECGQARAFCIRCSLGSSSTA